MRLKICDSHLTCKVANKCLNVRERVEVVERNKLVPSLPLLSCELSVCVKENPDRKKKKKLLPFTINFNFGHFFSCPVKFKIIWNWIWIKIHKKPWYLTKTLKTFKTSKILLLWKLLIAQSNKRMLFCFWRQRPILLLNLVKEQVIEVSNLNKIYRTVVIICTHCDIEKLSRGFLKSRYSKHFETFVMLALPKTIRKQSYKFIEGQ